MKNNILPFGIIAVVGVFAAIIVFYIGVVQKEEIYQANSGEAEVEEGEVELDGEVMYANSCAGCHGADLSGSMGPDLTQIGSTLSEEEISSVILNGQGAMPAISISQEEADFLAEWLSNHE